MRFILTVLTVTMVAVTIAILVAFALEETVGAQQPEQSMEVEWNADPSTGFRVRIALDSIVSMEIKDGQWIIHTREGRKED